MKSHAQPNARLVDNIATGYRRRVGNPPDMKRIDTEPKKYTYTFYFYYTLHLMLRVILLQVFNKKTFIR